MTMDPAETLATTLINSLGATSALCSHTTIFHGPNIIAHLTRTPGSQDAEDARIDKDMTLMINLY